MTNISTPRSYDQYDPHEIYLMVRYASPEAIPEIAKGLNNQQFTYLVDHLKNPTKVKLIKAHFKGILTNKA